MKLLYSAPTLFMVQHQCNRLLQAGIEGEIRNEFAGGAMGEIGFADAWPQLWVEVGDFERAQGVLKGEGDEQESWVCEGCGEVLEGVFGVCWRCG